MGARIIYIKILFLLHTHTHTHTHTSLYLLISVVGDDGVTASGAHSREGAHKPEDGAANLTPHWAVIERIKDEYWRF